MQQKNRLGEKEKSREPSPRSWKRERPTGILVAPWEDGIQTAPCIEGSVKIQGLFSSPPPGSNSTPYLWLGEEHDFTQFITQQTVDQVWFVYPEVHWDRLLCSLETLERLSGPTPTPVVVATRDGRDGAEEFLFKPGEQARPPKPFYPHHSKGLKRFMRRAQDLAIASIIWLLISPFLTLMVLGTKLTSKGPVFFRQWRQGLYCRPFRIFKLSTMKVVDDGTRPYEQAARHDSRLTPFGALLRRFSLDELPQFFNVLLGNMSVVGPRPHPMSMNAYYADKIPGYMLRHMVKPGITGWAQVNGWRGQTDTYEKIYQRTLHDLAYIRKRSYLWDLQIVLKTIFEGFFDDNAY